jgi:hypothetical protein
MRVVHYMGGSLYGWFAMALAHRRISVFSLYENVDATHIFPKEVEFQPPRMFLGQNIGSNVRQHRTMHWIAPTQL